MHNLYAAVVLVFLMSCLCYGNYCMQSGGVKRLDTEKKKKNITNSKLTIILITIIITRWGDALKDDIIRTLRLKERECAEASCK